MSCPLLMTLVALVQSGWTVEETPLDLPGFQTTSADLVDERGLTFIGVHAEPGVDAGPYRRPPIDRWVLGFVELGGEQPQELVRTTSWMMTGSEAGTGWTLRVEADGGTQLFRARSTDGRLELISLGVVTSGLRAVTCDDTVRDCLVIDEAGAARWAADGGRTPFAMTDDGPLQIDGAAMHPDGGWLALSVASNAVLLDPAGKLTAFRGDLEWKPKSLAAVTEGPRGKLAARFERLSQTCITTPWGWSQGRLIVGQQAYEDIGGGACDVTPFEFDPVKHTRTRQPAYPWQVLDCPKGGWTSRVGTFVTECEEEIRRMMRPSFPPRPDGPGAEEAPPDLELPEAIALSEREIFVMARPRPKKWRWYAPGASLKGKGLEFVLAGPSVVTFKPNGVVVEPVTAWKYGSATFEEPLADDWHLITAEGRPHVVRLRRD